MTYYTLFGHPGIILPLLIFGILAFFALVTALMYLLLSGAL